MPEPVRVASTPTETPVDQTSSPAPLPASSSDIKVPELFATYEQDQGKPYTADYFDLSTIWSEEPTLKNEIKTIEGYLREQVQEGKISNQTKEVERFIKELEKKAGTNQYDPTTKRLQRLLAYIDFRKIVDA